MNEERERIGDIGEGQIRYTGGRGRLSAWRSRAPGGGLLTGSLAFVVSAALASLLLVPSLRNSLLSRFGGQPRWGRRESRWEQAGRWARQRARELGLTG